LDDARGQIPVNDHAGFSVVPEIDSHKRNTVPRHVVTVYAVARKEGVRGGDIAEKNCIRTQFLYQAIQVHLRQGAQVISDFLDPEASPAEHKSRGPVGRYSDFVSAFTECSGHDLADGAASPRITTQSK
jgi:hypothetical protein